MKPEAKTNVQAPSWKDWTEDSRRGYFLRSFWNIQSEIQSIQMYSDEVRIPTCSFWNARGPSKLNFRTWGASILAQSQISVTHFEIIFVAWRSQGSRWVPDKYNFGSERLKPFYDDFSCIFKQRRQKPTGTNFSPGLFCLAIRCFVLCCKFQDSVKSQSREFCKRCANWSSEQAGRRRQGHPTSIFDLRSSDKLSNPNW